MQFRNGLRSVRRSPIKSILFFILVSALTVTVILGATLVYTCEHTIAQCKQTYVTTASLEYEGGAYPNQDVLDETARDLQSQIDLDALAQNPAVLETQLLQTAAVRIHDFQTLRRNMKAYTSVVLDVSVRTIYEENGLVLCYVNRPLYATSIKSGRTIYLFDSEMEYFGYTPEEGQRFLICGESDGTSTGNSYIFMQDIMPAAATAAGEVLPSPIVPVTSDDYSQSDPLYAPFFNIAASAEAVNESRYAMIAPNPAILREFTQNEYLLKQGAFYTRQECADGTLRCLLPEDVATRCNYAVGDTISLDLFSVAEHTLEEACWAPNQDTKTVSCIVSGIYSSDIAETLRIYLSDADDVKTGLIGYELGTLLLENGTVSVPQLPNGVKATLLDQGYVSVDRALRELRSGAQWLLGIAILVAVALLLLFAFLFVGRQAEALQTMKMLGTKRSALRCYVLYATGAVLVPAVALACPVSLSLSGVLNQIFISMTSTDTSFSTTGISVIQPLQSPVRMSWWLLTLCTVSIAVTGVLLSLLFLRLAFRSRKPRLKKTPKTAPHEHKSSMQRGAAKKYVTLSIVRGGMRSVVVPGLCLLLAVFLLALGYTAQSYRVQHRQLDESTDISGYFTDYTGRYRTNLMLPQQFIEQIEQSQLIKNVVVFYQSSYLFTGQTFNAAGRETAPISVEVPCGSFAYESFVTNLEAGPKLIFTADVLASGGFEKEGKSSITWLDGYDDTYFTDEKNGLVNLQHYDDDQNYYVYEATNFFTFDEDNRTLCCVVPSAFLDEYGVKLGESVSFYTIYNSVIDTPKYKIIGTYEAKSAAGTIYTRLDNCAESYNLYFRSKNTPVVSMRESFSGGSFHLKDTSQLQEAKQIFADMGFSAIRTSGRYRMYPVFEDSEYLNTAKKLESNLSFMQMLNIAAIVLSMSCGLAAAFLMAAKRKAEIAVLRSLGATQKMAFRVFFCEQLLLCVFGTLLGMLLWLFIEPWSLRVLPAVSFAAGYLIATACSLRKASRANLLSVLSEKE